MAVLIPQVVTEDRASGAQVIENSLRFDKTKSQYLTRTPGSAGNRKKSTISYWIKRTIPVSKFSPTTASVFGVEGGSSWFDLSYYTVDEIQFVLNAGVGDQGMKTQASYRDFSNWYHVCAVLDTDRTNDDGANSRMRVWVNGKETVQKATSSGQPAAGTFTFLNDSSRAHHIGRDGRTSSIRYGDNYLAQFYIVDGLVLGPDHFGYYDPLTNVWRPKKFTADGTTINDGRSWSGTSSVSNNNNNNNGAGSLAVVFNGTQTANSSNAYGFTTGAMDFTWTPNTPIPFGTQVRVWTGFSGGTVYLNGNQEVVTTNNNAWTTLVNGKSGSIESIRFVGGSGGGWWSGVEVDGVVLVNSTTQNLDFGTNGCYLPLDGDSPIGQDQSGKGNDWTPVNFGGSTDITKATGARPILNTGSGGTVARSGVFGSDVSASYATTSASNSGGKYYFSHDASAQPTFSFIRGATYIFDYSASTSHPLRFATAADAAGSTEYTDGTSISGNVIKFTVPHNAPDTLYYYCNVHNGMGNSISVTTDETKADPYAWKCTVAMPLLDYANGTRADFSHDLNCTTASKSTDYDAITDFANPGGMFYDKVAKFVGDGSNDRVRIPTGSFAMGTGDFTIEFWGHFTATGDQGNRNARILTPQSESGNYFQFLSSTSAAKVQFKFNGGGDSDIAIPNSLCLNRTRHYVYQRTGTTGQLIVDGVLYDTGTDNVNYPDVAYQIGRYDSSNGGASLYMSDLRAYTGIQKYSTTGKSIGDQLFIPASTEPNFIPDSPSGVATKSKLKEITDGAVFIDRSDNGYLQVGQGSTNFRLDGQYCIEFFLKLTEYSNDSVYVRTFVLDGPTGDGGSTNIHLNVNPSSGAILLWSGSSELIGAQLHVTGNWHHICLTRDSSNKTRLFVDGVLNGSATITTDYDPNSGSPRPRLGALGNTGGTSGYYSNWRIIKGSIPTEYQTSTTTLFDRAFYPPSEPLTTTSQGATANDVKLIACQDTVEPGGAVVAPTISGPNNGTQWSSNVTPGSKFRSGYGPGNAFDGNSVSNINGTTACEINEVSFVEFNFGDGIPFTTLQMQCDDNNEGTVKVNGVDITNQLPTGSFTNTTINGVTSPLKTLRLDAVNANASSVYLGSITIDGVMLQDPVSTNGGPLATNFNPFNTDIDTVRGQEAGYCTLNPADGFVSLKDGNLENINSTGWQGIKGTLGMSTGKFYWESQNNQTADAILGMTDTEAGPFKDGAIFGSTGHGGGDINPAWCWAGANYYFNGTSASSGGMSNHVATDVVQYAFDADAGKLWFGRNGVWFSSSWAGDGDPASGTNATVMGIDNTKTYVPCATVHNGGAKFNFGQKPFKFPPPDGFQPITTSTARPITTIARPDQHVGTTLYTGNNTVGREIDMGRKFDLVWVKKRNANENHILVDRLRGANNFLMSDSPNKANTSGGPITALNDTSIVVDNNGYVNGNGDTYVAWSWRAGGGKPGGGGFFKDDVEYPNAAALNMSVGALNSVLYNQDAVWSNNLSANTGSVSYATEAFDGSVAYSQQAHTGASTGSNDRVITATLNITLNNDYVEVYPGETYSGFYATIDGTAQPTRYITSVNGWQRMGPYTGTLNSVSVTNGTESSNRSAGIRGIRVANKILVDQGVTPPNLPSDPTTAVSVGTEQGFSILKWTGGGANTTLAHGLTKAPQFMMVKHLANNSTNWIVYHHRLADATKYLRLNSTATQQTQVAAWDSQHPTSGVIHFGAEVEANHDGQPMIAYVWHDVPGLQKFGRWTNNNSIYGAYINLGFKPAIILLKDIDGGEDWYIIDSIRHPHNQAAPSSNASGAVNTLNPNTNHNETTSRGGHTNTTVDILSNGFKIRTTNVAAGEISYGTRNYVYAAWAEAPTFNLYGAQSNAR